MSLITKRTHPCRALRTMEMAWRVRVCNAQDTRFVTRYHQYCPSANRRDSHYLRLTNLIFFKNRLPARNKTAGSSICVENTPCSNDRYLNHRASSFLFRTDTTRGCSGLATPSASTGFASFLIHIRTALEWCGRRGWIFHGYITFVQRVLRAIQ